MIYLFLIALSSMYLFKIAVESNAVIISKTGSLIKKTIAKKKVKKNIRQQMLSKKLFSSFANVGRLYMSITPHKPKPIKIKRIALSV